MVKLACMTLPYAGFAFERALEGIARAGYRYVAFGLAHAGAEVPDERDEHAAARLRTLFARYGLEPVMLIANAQFAPGQPLERACRRLRMAKELGIRELLTVGTSSYRSFPEEPLGDEEQEAANRLFVEHYRRIAEEAGALDLIVTIKPHTGNTATAAHIRETLQRINSPHVRGSYDPGNVQYYEGLSAELDFPQMAGETYSLIVKDHRGARANADFPVPGTGDVNFPQLFAAMKAAGFAGNVVVERVDGPDEAGHIDRRLAESRMQVERMLRQAGFVPE